MKNTLLILQLLLILHLSLNLAKARRDVEQLKELVEEMMQPLPTLPPLQRNIIRGNYDRE